MPISSPPPRTPAAGRRRPPRAPAPRRQQRRRRPCARCARCGGPADRSRHLLQEAAGGAVDVEDPGDHAEDEKEEEDPAAQPNWSSGSSRRRRRCRSPARTRCRRVLSAADRAHGVGQYRTVSAGSVGPPSEYTRSKRPPDMKNTLSLLALSAILRRRGRRPRSRARRRPATRGRATSTSASSTTRAWP